MDDFIVSTSIYIADWVEQTISDNEAIALIYYFHKQHYLTPLSQLCELVQAIC